MSLITARESQGHHDCWCQCRESQTLFLLTNTPPTGLTDASKQWHLSVVPALHCVSCYNMVCVLWISLSPARVQTDSHVNVLLRYTTELHKEVCLISNTPSYIFSTIYFLPVYIHIHLSYLRINHKRLLLLLNATVHTDRKYVKLFQINVLSSQSPSHPWRSYY